MSWFVEERARYEAWAQACFTEEQRRTLVYDEAGYPRWSEVEEEFKACVAQRALVSLDHVERNAALFLIARSWDVPIIVPWLSDASPALGFLSEDEVLFLSRACCANPDRLIDDARYQLAVVLARVVTKRDEARELLLRFFECSHRYTKVQALESLAKLKHAGLRSLVETAWDINGEDDQYTRAACLNIIARYMDDERLLHRYLARADSLPGEDLAAAVKHYRAKG